jgi:hypothetical protein
MENTKSSVDPIYENLRKVAAGYRLSLGTCADLIALVQYRQDLAQDALRNGYSNAHKSHLEYVENKIKELLNL